jgi:hypothetical protein
MPVNTIVLGPGQTVSIPANVEITGIIGSNFTSDCGTRLPEPETYSCYYMAWGYSATEGDNATLENDAGVILDYITVGGTTYNIGLSIVTDAATVKGYIEAAVPQALMKVYSAGKNVFSRREEFVIKFKTVPSLAGTLKMHITGLSFPDGLTLDTIPDTNCDCVSGFDENICDASEDGDES